jgi:hypothetical protein
MSGRYYSKRIKDIMEKAEKARGNRSRPKTFKSKELAKAWADKNKVKDYTLKNLKNPPNNKIVIVTKT